MGAVEEMICVVCYRGGIVGMDVIWRPDVVCMCLVTVLNAIFGMTCSLLMLVEDARGAHMEEECLLTAL